MADISDAALAIWASAIALRADPTTSGVTPTAQTLSRVDRDLALRFPDGGVSSALASLGVDDDAGNRALLRMLASLSALPIPAQQLRNAEDFFRAALPLLPPAAAPVMTALAPSVRLAGRTDVGADGDERAVPRERPRVRPRRRSRDDG